MYACTTFLANQGFGSKSFQHVPGPRRSNLGNSSMWYFVCSAMARAAYKHPSSLVLIAVEPSRLLGLHLGCGWMASVGDLTLEGRAASMEFLMRV